MIQAKFRIMKFRVIVFVFLMPFTAIAQLDTVTMGDRVFLIPDLNHEGLEVHEQINGNRTYTNVLGAVGFGNVRNLSLKIEEKVFSQTVYEPCGGYSVRFDGYDYATVQIGDQCWFAENLRSERFVNGDSLALGVEWNWDGATIIYGEPSSVATTLTEGSNDTSANLAAYGRLYTWSAITDGRGLCPTGWHVPTDEEWTELSDYLGGESIAGAKLKSTSTNDPSWNGTNSSGFSALAGGRVALAFLSNPTPSYLIFYQGIEEYTAWWASSGYVEPDDGGVTPLPTTGFNFPQGTIPIRFIGEGDSIARIGSNSLLSHSVRCLLNQ